jgi:hypothetical protein
LTSQLAAQLLAAAVRNSADLSAVRTGSVSSTSAIETLANEHFDPRPYSNVIAGLEALNAGKLDAFLCDRPILQLNVRKDFRDDIQVLDKALCARELRHRRAARLPASEAARRRHAGRNAWPLVGGVLRRYLGNDPTTLSVKDVSVPFKQPQQVGLLSQPYGRSMMPEKSKKNDDRNRYSEQPQERASAETHDPPPLKEPAEQHADLILVPEVNELETGKSQRVPFKRRRGTCGLAIRLSTR